MNDSRTIDRLAPPVAHASPPSAAQRWLLPSLSDFLFAALVLWLLAFTNGGSPNGLLQDAAAGFHIRTGEYIVANASVPHLDPFSFSKPAAPWFAWEWLADVLMAGLHQTAGLKGIILATAFLLGGTVWISLRHMGSRGAHALATLFVMHALVGAGSIHFLARPHVLTLLFLAAAFWLLDHDRLTPTPWLWGLVPLTALWANLHGGFAGLIITLVVLAAGSVLEARFDRARRYAVLAAACLAATLANPYGFELIAHMQQYLRAGWIREIVQEFQAPKLESVPGMYFEFLLFTGLACAARLAWSKRYAEALLVAAWAHAALLSVRHVPIYALLVAPYLAVELTALMRAAAEAAGRRSIWRILNDVGDEHAPSLARSSVWIPAMVVLFFAFDLGLSYPTDFPTDKYPVVAVEKKAAELRARRVFSLDSWGDYLVYKLPGVKVFFDGRTDYYGETRSREYMTLLEGKKGWPALLEKYRVDALLLPEDCPMVDALKHDPAWRFERPEAGVAWLARR